MPVFQLASHTLRTQRSFALSFARQTRLRTPHAHIRPLSHASRLPYPKKDAQHKDSIDTEPSEYSKSGTDDGAAREQDAAFDPSITDPHEQERKAGTKSDGTKTDDNPLNVSPANPEVSKARGGTEGGAEKGKGQSASGAGSTQKGSKVR